MHLFLWPLLLLATPDEAFVKNDVEAWHQERLERLVAEDGWLTLVGLFEVKSSHTAGSRQDNDFVFPAPTPPRLGVFEKTENGVTLTLQEKGQVTLNGQPFDGGLLKSDADDKPDVLRRGSLTFFVLSRGDRLFLRLKDSEAPSRKKFSGIERFPFNPKFRVEATFVPHAEKKVIPVPTVLGTVEKMTSPGVLTFVLDGKTFRLLPVREEGGKELFVLFTDTTARTQTYPSGRFLYTPLPREGKVTLDFNRAYNPPCAFTLFATCPLPPFENRLPVAIEAGEKRYKRPSP